MKIARGRKAKKQGNTFKSQEQKHSTTSSAGGKHDKSNRKFRLRFRVDERTRRVAGLALLVITFLLLLSFISHLFSWKGDYSYLDISAAEFFGDNSIKPHNLIGKTGAFVSHYFVTRWFGVSSFLFILLFITTGLRWFSGFRLLPEGKLYRHVLFLILFISVASGFIFRGEELLLLGGGLGYHSRAWLESMFGKVGSGFVLFFVLAVYLLVSFNFLIRFLKKREEEKASSLGEGVAESEENTIKSTEEGPVSENGQEESGGSETTGQIVGAPETGEKREHELSVDQEIKDTQDAQEKFSAENFREGRGKEEPGDLELTIEKPKEENQAEAQASGKGREHYKIDTPYDPTLELRD
ncbi:MAG: DNA translocase FtsK 4TM domain-containing protein, partial [Bacteroidales bacterium]